MTTAVRISPTETRERLKSPASALLVCAYDDEQKCASLKLPGSITLRQLHQLLPSLTTTQEIIFY